jgi:hypothetical protein
MSRKIAGYGPPRNLLIRTCCYLAPPHSADIGRVLPRIPVGRARWMVRGVHGPRRAAGSVVDVTRHGDGDVRGLRDEADFDVFQRDPTFGVGG